MRFCNVCLLKTLQIHICSTTGWCLIQRLVNNIMACKYHLASIRARSLFIALCRLFIPFFVFLLSFLLPSRSLSCVDKSRTRLGTSPVQPNNRTYESPPKKIYDAHSLFTNRVASFNETLSPTVLCGHAKISNCLKVKFGLNGSCRSVV